MGDVLSHFGSKPKQAPEPPDPNVGPVEINGVLVVHRVCTCCKQNKKGDGAKFKVAFFVVDEAGKPLQMALTWESLCEVRGWV